MRVQTTNPNKKTAIIIAALALVLIVAGIVYAMDQRNKQYATEQYGTPDTNPSSDTPNSDKDQNSSSPSISNDKTPTEPTTPSNDITPSTPIGTFVSNHRPNLDGSPRPNIINSTCTTTPGVTCYIRFTKGSEVKTLLPQTTDGSGNTAWTWNINDIGLSVGDWQIEAVAKNGSKEAVAKDPTPLMVES